MGRSRMSGLSEIMETYTPLEKFGSRLIDLKTFLEGIKINFRQRLSLSSFNAGKRLFIAAVDRLDVKINAAGIAIDTDGIIYTLQFGMLDSSIEEVSNESSTTYIFQALRNRRLFYRVEVW
jgi:hypothetical protein